MFYRQDTRYLGKKNQRLVRKGAFEQRSAVNVWLGILGLNPISPMFSHTRP